MKLRALCSQESLLGRSTLNRIVVTSGSICCLAFSPLSSGQAAPSTAEPIHESGQELGPGLRVALQAPAAQPPAAKSDTKSSIAPVDWCFLILWTATKPSPFEGSDGRTHLAYDLVMSNFAGKSGVLKELEISDAVTKKVLLSLTGKSLEEVVTKIAPKGENNESGLKFAPSEFAVGWINLSFDHHKDVPTQLSHRVVIASTDQDNAPKTFDYKSDVVVENVEPVKIGPPLKGGKWLAVGGYSSLSVHRRALLPISNHLYAAQTFAIDWVRLDQQNNQIVGDRSKMENNVSYGQPVIAVNDATVVGVTDRFKDQPADKPSGSERFEYPTGNTIILDLGHGYYATYAHLKPGSIKVKEGDQVSRGQTIAQVGNSGNSSGPHLHFHITKGLGPLDAPGVPYLIDAFEQLGELEDIEKFMQSAEPSKTIEFAPSKYDGKHLLQLPRQGTVVKFAE